MATGMIDLITYDHRRAGDALNADHMVEVLRPPVNKFSKEAPKITGARREPARGSRARRGDKEGSRKREPKLIDAPSLTRQAQGRPPSQTGKAAASRGAATRRSQLVQAVAGCHGVARK